MYELVEKLKENKGRAVANNVGQKKSTGKQGFAFIDNRQKSILQRQISNGFQVEPKLQAVVNKGIMQLGKDPLKDKAETQSEGGNLDASTRNKIVRANIDPRLRAFYLSIPAFQTRAIMSFHAYGLNPFSMPLALMSSWRSLDPSLQYLRSFGTLNRALSNYTDTSPGALVSQDNMRNFQWNMLAMGDGVMKRVVLQSMAMRTIRNPYARRLFIGANIMMQFGGQALLKDKQIREAAQEQNLTREDIDIIAKILGNDTAKAWFGLRQGKSSHSRVEELDD